MHKIIYASIIGILFFNCSGEQKPKLEEILKGGSDEFQQTLNNPTHEIQIVYGEIVADSIVHHTFGVDETVFFYPASTVKMPIAFAALKKAEELGVSIDDALLIDSTAIYPRNVHYDSLFQDSLRLRNLIVEIFTVSDNAAYNHLYGWLGKDYINKLYHSHGMRTRIQHQLSESAFGFNPISNDYSRKSRVIGNGQVYQQDEMEQTFSYAYEVTDQQKGIGYIDSLGNLADGAFNFSQKNFVPLSNLLTILEMAVRPDLVEKNAFDFSSSTNAFIKEAMGMLPKDLPHPYDTLKDNYVKFLQFGNEESGTVPPNIRMFNKVGWAYGYLLDVAYVQDLENEIAFFLAAIIHVNENQIYNDGVYEYEEIGLPFLDELGDLVYAYERTR